VARRRRWLGKEGKEEKEGGWKKKKKKVVRKIIRGERDV